MVSIPHYEDLSAQAIYDSLNLSWRASEKLDGSYILFGLDDDGRYFSRRKGGSPCYVLDDWPDECWTATYRSGHTIGSMVIEALVKENLISWGQNIGAEILHGELPNSTPYIYAKASHGIVFITNMNFAPNAEFSKFFSSFHCRFQACFNTSPDGIKSEIKEEDQKWIVAINPLISHLQIQARLSSHARSFKKILDHWFPKTSNIPGFSVLEVLDINLSKKHVNCGSRNWNTLKKELAKERNALKEVFLSMVLMFKDIAYRVLVLEQPSSIGAGSFKEGVVVSSDQGLFKIVDHETFRAANRFTHIIKYWIVGGRRPARPSFLSRTKHWPKEQRLARLDVLLKRYHRYRLNMPHFLVVGGRTNLLMYSGQLHERTLNMFSDTRKRIEDGR